MSEGPEYSVQITHANDALSDLEPSWKTAVFSEDDGIGSMDSLHQAGDALVAVAEFGEEGMTVHGSGVMVAPGVLLTATHVLDVFDRRGAGPVFCTFLPTGMRAWLPIDVITISGPSAFYHDRKVTSDLSLVSCTLNSEAHADQPLMLAPMQVALPLIGDRLWAMGFRHQHIDNGGTYVTPLVSSGLVTAAYPNGRGERMASPCFEVEMEAIGGMSGGAVVNADGLLVGIVSSSFDGAPTYVTLIWDALRMDVKPPIAKLSTHDKVSLFGAKAKNLAKIKGDVSRDPFGEVTFRMTEAEGKLMAEANARDKVEPGRSRALNDEQLEAFEEEWNSELEDAAGRGAIEYLAGSSLGRMRAFIAMSGAPATCLEAVTAFTVEDFDGVEDFDVTFTERTADGSLRLECLFELRRAIWNLEVSPDQYRAHQSDFETHFFVVESDEERLILGLTQRCVFKGVIGFDEVSETFDDAEILSTAVKRPRVVRKKA
jgi:hypothetical protein